MSEHPIALLVSDDLERTRLTVLVRWLLAIPHYAWVLLWGIAALLAAVANWFATLALGRSPAPLHRFLAAYVKYVTQLYGYLYLAANPYPPFDGRDGYPLDLTIAPPAPQSRWRVALRAILVLPAAVFATTLVGLPQGRYRSAAATHTRASWTASTGSLLLLVAVLGWFVVLVRGRTPRGLRDTAAYCLGYAAQAWAYALLLTERYPDSDPQRLLADLPETTAQARLSLDDELARTRLTVFFRGLLAIPHLVWLALWGVVVLLAAIATWFAVLFTGGVPESLRRFLSGYLRYQMHVYGFLYLLANPFPGFTGAPGSYPLEVSIQTPARQRRWTVLLRLVLALPAIALTSAFGTVASVAAVLGWFASLATGRMPRGLRGAGALALGYQLQTAAYVLLVCDAYPYTGPTRPAGAAARSHPPAAAAPPEPPSAPAAGPAFG